MHTTVDFSQLLPDDFYQFLIVTVFSFLIGMEQRTRYANSTNPAIFGTDRTFTFIGILGFVLYIIQPVSLIPFLVGIVLLGAFFLVFYLKKISNEKSYGLTTIILALITYCLTPLVYTQPHWLVLLIVIILLVLEELKESLFKFSQKMSSEEFIILGKFLIMSGVILPLLPNKEISAKFDFSPYKFWLAIVAISGISYGSYLLKKYVFPKSGILLTGLLGGMYSSTATTFILARKSKEIDEPLKIAAAIVLATSMMFVRIFVLALLFNTTIANHIALAFALLFFLSLSITAYLIWLDKKSTESNTAKSAETVKIETSLGNPLELKTAFTFGILFILFSVVTHFVTQHYSEQGIKILSYLVGVTDIDPFIINIFQSKFNVSVAVLSVAIINAVTSNNLLKLIYALVLSAKSIHKYIIVSFSLLILLGITLTFLI